MAKTTLDPATDVGAFGEMVLGRPLWTHQLEFARSDARYRVVCAGRQVGKSTGVAVMALFEAATRAGILVMIVSLGEVASQRLLEECVGLATSSSILQGSVVDESKSLLTLSNGSRIMSVPASERQIRGWPVDLLIVDEAGFIPESIWNAAEPAIIARPGSRVVLLSSPWGGPEHFFRRLWNRGMDSPDGAVAAWHWPSSVSPLVDKKLLAFIKSQRTEEVFRREFLAEWTDAAGSYFTEAEIMSCVATYEMTPPESIDRWIDRPYVAVGGVDWGVQHDANVIMLISVLEDQQLNAHTLAGDLVYFIPHFEYRHGWAYTDFIDRIVEISKRYHLQVIASETNGVGQMPTDELQRRLYKADTGSWVYPVSTNAKRKMSGYGALKLLMQQHRIVLPNEPELLKQLRGLEFQQQASGNLQISVPDKVGHDDIADALMQAVSCLNLQGAVRFDPRPSWNSDWYPASDWAWNAASAPKFSGETVETSDPRTGDVIVRLPRQPLPVAHHTDGFMRPQGRERGDGW